MTWAEFYAGEVGQTSSDLLEAGLDAVSTATTHVDVTRFSQLVTSSSDATGNQLKGVKAVQVRMSDAVYNALTDKTRYTFSDDANFAEYKEVNADGSFGKMVTESKDATEATVTVASGANSTWGHYTLTVNGIDTIPTANYLGATAETSDGKIYGLRHLNNLWFQASAIAFPISDDYVGPHNPTRSWKYTSDIEGKTITKITYIVKDSPDIVVSCDAFLKYRTATTAAATPDKEAYNAGDTVTFTFTDNPDGVTYDVSVLGLGAPGRHGLSYNAVDSAFWTYNTATRQLVLSSELPTGTYRVTFVSDQYSDINSETFTVTGTYAYATTDMTYKEFYETEGIDNALSMDAVSSATVGKAARFAVLSYDIVSADTGVVSADGNITKIYGLKDVQLRFDASYWNATASSDKRYKSSSVPFAEYKVVDDEGKIGKLSTDIEQITGATVTLRSSSTDRNLGGSAWGNYWLVIDGVKNIDVSEKFLGAVLETSDEETYGLQHLYNLFFKNNEMAFCVKDFTEPHNNKPAYAHTAALEGKTIKKITWLLKDAPDYYISCDVYVKKQADAIVTPVYQDGYTVLVQTQSMTMNFNGVPTGELYDVVSVTPSARHATAFDKSLYSYSSGDKTFTAGMYLTGGVHKVVFENKNYIDVATSIKVLDTDATNLVISNNKNLGKLNFLLTPRGAITSIDKEMEDNKLAPVSEFPDLVNSTTAEYNEGNNNVAGSGFSMDIAVGKGVSSDYYAILGVGKQFYLTPENLGTEGFALVKNALDKMEVGDSGYYEFGEFKDLAPMGLRAVAVNSDGTSSDMGEFSGAGLMVSDDENIMLYYGTMFADTDKLPGGDGEYNLSPEGEFLIADGTKDDHIKATWYVEKFTPSSEKDETKEPDTEKDTETEKEPAKGEDKTTEDEPENGKPGTTSTPTITPQTAKPEVPSTTLQANITKKTVVDTVVGEIKKLFSGLPETITSLTPLTASTNKSTKTAPKADELPATQRAAIETKSQDIAVIIDPIKVEEPGIYVFAVDREKFADLKPGWPIFIYMFTDAVDIDAIDIAAADENAAVFINDSGEVINKLPDEGNVNISAYMEADTDYTPVIATKVNDSDEDSDNIGDSGSGCDSGFSIMAIIAFAGVFAHMKRK